MAPNSSVLYYILLLLLLLLYIIIIYYSKLYSNGYDGAVRQNFVPTLNWGKFFVGDESIKCFLLKAQKSKCFFVADANIQCLLVVGAKIKVLIESPPSSA